MKKTTSERLKEYAPRIVITLPFMDAHKGKMSRDTKNTMKRFFKQNESVANLI